MKDKIVFWGTDEKENDILVTLRLRATDNKVDIWSFPKEGLTDEFVDKMFKDWDDIEVENFPASAVYIEHDMSEPSLLPNTIRAKNTDIVNRAEKEWYVKVLSAKLSSNLEAEIGQLWAQVEGLNEFDKELWATSKAYWDKVNQHFTSRDLAREHAMHLRDKINACFDKLKSFRGTSNEDWTANVNATVEKYTAKIEEITQQIDKSKSLAGLFDQLRQIQEELKDVQLNKEGRIKLRAMLNEAFENIRGERKTSRNSRLEQRVAGLENALKRMEDTVEKDKESLNFQQSRIENTSGKLEAQLREAKISMIKSRLDSKLVKLEDMKKTLADLKVKLESGNFTEEDLKPTASELDNNENNRSSGNTIGDILEEKLSSFKTPISAASEETQA